MADAAEKWRRPVAEAELNVSCERETNQEQDVGFLAEDEPQGFTDRLLLGIYLRGLAPAANRLFYGEAKDQRDEQAWQTSDEKRAMPAIVLIDPAANEGTEKSAKDRAQLIDRHGHGALVAREEIGNDGGGGSRAGGFSDSDAEPRG